MARAPLQIIAIPFRKTAANSYQFAVFHRADGSMWQFLSGGAEDHESPYDAAVREAHEEAGIAGGCRWIRLDSKASIPRTAFPSATHWPRELFIVPEYSFAVEVTGPELTLSQEHDEVRWLPYEEARKLLTWDSNRVALWELDQRLRPAAEQGAPGDANQPP